MTHEKIVCNLAFRLDEHVKYALRTYGLQVNRGLKTWRTLLLTVLLENEPLRFFVMPSI